MSGDEIHESIVRRLGARVRLDDADRAAIYSLPCTPRTFEPAAYVVREGAPPSAFCGFVLSGLAFRQKLTSTGGRQIVSINMVGDFLDLQHLFLGRSDHNVQALTRLATAEIDRKHLRDVALTRPNVGQALWSEALVDASIFREWVVNIGRRDARSRIAHLLCEYAVRAKAAGIADDEGYNLPMTQEQLGDAVGLTSVHVNRILKSLTVEGLIRRDKRKISFVDWDGLSAAGDFSALYLHMDQQMDGQMDRPAAI